MSKKQKRRKSGSQSKLKLNQAVRNESKTVSAVPVLKPLERKGSFFVMLARNPRFVGALNWMLWGCLACGTFLTILFTEPNFGKFYANLSYFIASFIPPNFIPPQTFIPGVISIPASLLIIFAFTTVGYFIGSAPINFKIEQDSRSFGEKLIELIVFSVIVFLFLFFKFRTEKSPQNFGQIISEPFNIAGLIIILIALIYYAFSQYQNTRYQIFVLRTAAAICFLLFLLCFLAVMIFKSIFYALS